MSGISNNNNRHLLLYTLKWMSLYIGYRIHLSLIAPIPCTLLGAIGGFMLVNFLRARFMMKKMGISMKGLFGSLQSSRSKPFHVRI